MSTKVLTVQPIIESRVAAPSGEFVCYSIHIPFNSTSSIVFRKTPLTTVANLEASNITWISLQIVSVPTCNYTLVIRKLIDYGDDSNWTYSMPKSHGLVFIPVSSGFLPSRILKCSSYKSWTKPKFLVLSTILYVKKIALKFCSMCLTQISWRAFSWSRRYLITIIVVVETLSYPKYKIVIIWSITSSSLGW